MLHLVEVVLAFVDQVVCVLSAGCEMLFLYVLHATYAVAGAIAALVVVHRVLAMVVRRLLVLKLVWNKLAFELGLAVDCVV